MNCDTCHWKMSSDGRCMRGQSPNNCSEYMMDPRLKRAMEEHREREERERKERERQEWLKTDEGKKWQAEEDERKRKEREERERKEREHQEWLKTEEGQRWQAEEKQKEAEKKAREDEERKKNNIKSIKTDLKVIYIGSGIGALIGAVICFFIIDDVLGIFLGLWAGFGIGGNIMFIIYLIFFGFSAGCLGIILTIFLGPTILGLILLAFAIVGPIWPLIRILLKKKKLKEM